MFSCTAFTCILLRLTTGSAKAASFKFVMERGQCTCHVESASDSKHWPLVADHLLFVTPALPSNLQAVALKLQGMAENMYQVCPALIGSKLRQQTQCRARVCQGLCNPHIPDSCLQPTPDPSSVQRMVFHRTHSRHVVPRAQCIFTCRS